MNYVGGIISLNIKASHAQRLQKINCEFLLHNLKWGNYMKMVLSKTQVKWSKILNYSLAASSYFNKSLSCQPNHHSREKCLSYLLNKLTNFNLGTSKEFFSSFQLYRQILLVLLQAVKLRDNSLQLVLCSLTWTTSLPSLNQAL